MNLSHRFPNLYLIGSFSLLGLVALDNPALAVAEISEYAALEGIQASDTELHLEIFPVSQKAENVLEKIQHEQRRVGEPPFCSFKDAIALCAIAIQGKV